MKIFEELKKLIPFNAPVTEEILDECAYTKAAIKEIFRLNPISVGIGRILAEDAVLSGYNVPKGVRVQYIIEKSSGSTTEIH
jgi:ecdysteroid 25-hydroxylase CYP302A1